MKYEVGDVVTVRKDIKSGLQYGMEHEPNNCHVTTSMEKFAGKEVTICAVRRSTTGHSRYNIKEDNYAWFWVDGMFEKKVDGIEPEENISDMLGEIIGGVS